MITDAYSFIALQRKTRFIFESEGKQGKIIKIIQFTQLESNEWNLGFGDLKDGNIDDLIISNNEDVFKVIKTVAKVVTIFFQEYPQSRFIIKPIDDKRKKLYNSIFRRHFKDIILDFNILGIVENNKEAYSPQKNYDNFEITLKFEL